VRVRGPGPAGAVEAMPLAMGSACDVSGAAHLSADVAARSPEIAGGAVTALRLEGFAPSVAHRRRVLEALMQPLGDAVTIEEASPRALWQAVRDVPFFRSGGLDRPLWRVSTAPSRGAELGALVGREVEAQMVYDWAGGLLWLSLEPSDDAGAAIVRRAVTATGGHATLVPAPAPVRAADAAFPPQGPALAGMAARGTHSARP